MRGGALKEYTYNFRLVPQFISNTRSGAAAVDIFAAAGGTAAGPIQALGASVPGITNQTTTSPIATNSFDVGLGCNHKLGDIANVGAFASMYDAYKINYVVVDIEYLNNVNTLGSSQAMPTVWTYWDQDDSVPPVVTTNVTGKMGSKCWQPTANKTRFRLKYKPNLRSEVQSGDSPGASAGAVVMPARWINCTQIFVPHYAFKAWITDFFAPTPPTTVVNAFRVNFTYNVSFRAPLLTT